MTTVVIYLLAWFPMLVIAIVNGILREAVIKKYVSDHRAHQLSTLTLIAFFAVYIFFVVKKYPPVSGSQALLLGLLWVILTLVFEFGFGRYRGNSWQTLFAEYNLLRGKLWIFIPLWVTLAPWIFYQLMHY